MDSKKGVGSILQFALLQSAVDEGFWHRLSSLKLNKLGIDDSPISISGFYAPCSHAQISNHLTLYSDSFAFGINEEAHEPSSSDRNKCRVPGTLYNTNTLESFNAVDKRSLLVNEAKKIWADIQSGKAVEESGLLSRFLLITFADLKTWNFHYWFAFPAIVIDPPATLISLKPASKWCTPEEAKSLSYGCNKWRSSLGSTAEIPFFVVSFSSDSKAVVGELKDWEACHGYKVLFGFYDPCHLPTNPGWPLRNFLALVSYKWAIKKAHFLCYRENRGGFADLDSSLVCETLISSPRDWNDPEYEPKAVGWEVKRGRNGPCRIDLAKSMDPARLAETAAELNLKLMRWRALPSLNIDVLSNVKCLLLGAGTLGCQVARMLMAWGVRRITVLDSGRVSMSNPLRQSLYTLNDCVDGGDYKATAAVRSLKRIFPAVEAEEVVMGIPMPGHPVQSQATESFMNDCSRLHGLVDSHDAVFLLTDTRESRWLPTVLSSSANKIAVTAALGFDSFLVMRHGAGPCESASGRTEASASSPHQRLGCYFCNDVVAPVDSTSNRTLDQQCTVTRPGLAPLASSLAVELLVGILHHPSGIFAEAEFAGDSQTCESPLGILPHQIRGSLSQFSQMALVGRASGSCTACSDTVISEYRRRGMEFIMEVMNQPSYLEDMTGLTEMMKSACSFELESDASE